MTDPITLKTTHGIQSGIVRPYASDGGINEESKVCKILPWISTSALGKGLVALDKARVHNISDSVTTSGQVFTSLEGAPKWKQIANALLAPWKILAVDYLGKEVLGGVGTIAGCAVTELASMFDNTVNLIKLTGQGIYTNLKAAHFDSALAGLLAGIGALLITIPALAGSAIASGITIAATAVYQALKMVVMLFATLAKMVYNHPKATILMLFIISITVIAILAAAGVPGAVAAVALASKTTVAGKWGISELGWVGIGLTALLKELLVIGVAVGIAKKVIGARGDSSERARINVDAEAAVVGDDDDAAAFVLTSGGGGAT